MRMLTRLRMCPAVVSFKKAYLESMRSAPAMRPQSLHLVPMLCLQGSHSRAERKLVPT